MHTLKVISGASAVSIKVDGNLCFLRYVRVRDVLGSQGCFYRSKRIKE